MNIVKPVIPLLNNCNKVGVASAIIEQGEIQDIILKGISNKFEKNPIQINTLFQAGSISKSLTAWAVLKLVKEGKLKLDEPISLYLPNIEFRNTNIGVEAITIRRLLSHTAGLRRVSYTGNNATMEESLFIKNNKIPIHLVHPPDSFCYTGYGYSLIQIIIEKVTNMSFTCYMEDEVLLPLGMVSSSFELNRNKDLSSSYGYLGRKLPHISYVEKAAAGFLTNIEDLARFVCLNLSSLPSFLSANEINSMHTRIHRAIPYGLGFQIATIAKAEKVVWHYGHNRGWNSIIIFLPKRKDGLAILTNSDNGYEVINDFVIEWLQGKVGTINEANLEKLGLVKKNRYKRMLMDIKRISGERIYKLFHGV